jgi:diguanylate cyclase (GGDEF)-like protein
VAEPSAETTFLCEIVELCLQIDRKAVGIYSRFSYREDRPDVKLFWKRMAREELEHVRYWSRLRQLARDGALPQVFARPRQVREELGQINRKLEEIAVENWENLDRRGRFLTAYHLEFYLLHPAFQMLFDFLRHTLNEKTPDEDYDAHLNRFLAASREYCHPTPELSLLGETIQRLWGETKMLARQNTVDPLSEVLNRRGLLHILQTLSRLSQRSGDTLGLLMIDIDDFKQVNDTLGHLAGDRVIQSVARYIKAAVRTSDVVGRYGGEEFLVALYPVRPEALAATAEKIRAYIETRMRERIPVTVSIGAACHTGARDDAATVDDLVREADARLYAAKEAGKNCVIGDPVGI